MKYGKIQRTALAVLVSGAAVSTLLTGCSGSTSAAGPSNSMTYWSMWTKNEPQAQVIQNAADAFEKSTGVHVDIKWVGRDVLKNVGASLNGGTLPDLVDQDGGELKATFGASDAALGLNDVMSASITGENTKVGDVLPKSVMNRYQTGDGQPMMIPYELVSSALWFNGNQLPDMATKPPTTWTDFKAILDKEKSAGRVPLALDGDAQQYTSYWWTYAAVRHGGPGVVKDAVSDKTGAAWDNPALLAAAQDMEGLVKAGYFPTNSGGTKWPAQQSAWASGEGKADFLLMGSWAPSETAPIAAKNPSKFDYASLPYPQVVDGKGNAATEVSLIGFSIPKKAKSADNAKNFIKFFLNKDQLSGISTTALNLTPRDDIPVPAQLAGLKKQVDAAGTNTFEADDGVPAAYPQFSSESAYPIAQKLLLGQLDAQGFIQAMKDATVQFWKTKG